MCVSILLNRNSVFYVTSKLELRSDVATDVYERSQTSYTKLCNGIVSHETQFGDLQVFAEYTRKTKHNKCVYDLFVPHNFLCVSVFTLRPQYMQVM